MNKLLSIISSPITRLCVLVILAVLAVVALVNLTGWFRRLQDDNRRLSRSLFQTVQEMKEFRTRSGQLAAENEVMELRLKELSALYPNLIGEIRNLRVPPRRTESVSSTGYTTETRIVTILRDSIIMDTIEVKKFSYNDQWYTVTGLAQDSL
ncbi:MAG: DUF6549 family protein, partial [Bacteroidota bacterium]